MKFFITCMIVLPQLVLAYHSGTNKNFPVKEPQLLEETRAPAAVELKQKNLKKK